MDFSIVEKSESFFMCSSSECWVVYVSLSTEWEVIHYIIWYIVVKGTLWYSFRILHVKHSSDINGMAEKIYRVCWVLGILMKSQIFWNWIKLLLSRDLARNKYPQVSYHYASSFGLHQTHECSIMDRCSGVSLTCQDPHRSFHSCRKMTDWKEVEWIRTYAAAYQSWVSLTSSAVRRLAGGTDKV